MRTYTNADQVGRNLTEFKWWIEEGRNPERRPLAPNTVAIHREGGRVAIRLHDTDVVTYNPDGSVTLDSGGWRTLTTRDRMARFMPGGWDIGGTLHGIWTVRRRGPVLREHIGPEDWRHSYTWPELIEFNYFDGIRFDPETAEVVNPGMAPDWAKVEGERARTEKAIRRYLRGLTDEVIESVLGDMAGDCLYCQFRPTDDPTLELSTDHLAAHVDERYYMGSLIVNATLHAGYRLEQLPWVIRLRPRELVGKYLRHHLRDGATIENRLGPAGRVASGGLMPDGRSYR